MSPTIFPNLRQEVAHYSPLSFFVHLQSITKQEYQTLIDSPSTLYQIKNLGIIYHEIRHNIDHFSTLWGQHNILKWYKAINARVEMNEYNFQPIVQHKKEQNQLHLDEYFTEHYRNMVWQTPEDTWQWTLTKGFRFNDNGSPDENLPILFVRYRYREGSIARVPLSVASLLETNAIWHEVNLRDTFIESLPNIEKLKEKAGLIKWKMRDLIYAPKLALYTTAVHLTANLLKLSDVNVALKISSSVATIVLNLPKSFTSKIPIENVPVWGDGPKLMIINHDLGFLFYTLLNNYKKTFLKTEEYSIQELLAANNLPDLENINLTVQAEMSSLIDELKGNHLTDYFTSKLLIGKGIFSYSGLDGGNMDIKQVLSRKLLIPDIRFKKDKAKSSFEDFPSILNSKPLLTSNPYEFYSLTTILNEKMDEFYNIRGV